MGRKPFRTANEKIQVILSVLRGEMTQVDAEAELSHRLAEDCTDPGTGEIFSLVIVTDNGPYYLAPAFAAFFAARPWLYHVGTRYRSPWTNGVIERFFGTLKYEGLYREEITNGFKLGIQIEIQRVLYNDVRPHEHLDFHTTRSRYLGPQPLPDKEIELPGQGPPINYNPEPPRPRTRVPVGD